MKNLTLILNIVLVIAVAVLYALYFSGNKPQAENAGPKAEKADSMQAAGLNVAYVNIDTVLSEYKLYQEMEQMFIQKQQKMEADLTSRSQNLEQRMADFQNKVKNYLITSTQAKQMQKELAQDQQRLMQLQSEMQGKLAQHEQSMMQQVYDSLRSFVDDYNAQKRYDLIISNQGSSSVLYGRPYMNITKDVLNGINSRYDRANIEAEGQE